jgi:polar amino acid transport system substrate-binding protein
MPRHNEKLVSPGVLTIGVDESPPPPLNFGVPGAPDFRGFEVDLMRELAARLGLEAFFVSALWSRMLDDLREGRVDVVCTAATVTPERLAAFDFSEAYLDTVLVIVTRGGDGPRTPADLAGRVVGARVATVAGEYARQSLGRSRIRTFDFNTDAYDALLAGDVEAVIDDRPIATHFVHTLPGLEIASLIGGTESHYALMLAKGNDGLRKALDRALGALRADGRTAEMRRAWFGDTGIQTQPTARAEER